MVFDLINNSRTKFNASVDDTFISTNNKNGSYTSIGQIKIRMVMIGFSLSIN